MPSTPDRPASSKRGLLRGLTALLVIVMFISLGVALNAMGEQNYGIALGALIGGAVASVLVLVLILIGFRNRLH